MEYINAIKYQPTGINGTLLKNQKSKEENKVSCYIILSQLRQMIKSIQK